MMTSAVHSIQKYTVQILNTKGRSDAPRTQIIIRLYSDEGEECGVAVFKSLDGQNAQNPTGDFRKRTATAYFDMIHYEAFIDILRREEELYWKVAWQQTGATPVVADVSLDTKEEIIGDHFGNGGA